MNHKSLQIKSVSADGTGLARIATLNVVDKEGDVTLPGAFGDEQVVKLLPTHNWDSVWLGKAKIHEHGNQVLADFEFNLNIQASRDWQSALKFDLATGPPISEWSYGFSILKSSRGEFQGRQVRFLEALKVHEVSPVVVGAGIDTGTLSIKHHAPAQVEQEARAILNQINNRKVEAKNILRQAAARTAIASRGEMPVIRLPAPPWLENIGEQIADELSISLPSVKLFREAEWGEQHQVILPNCWGIYRLENEILVQSKLSRHDLISVLAHEIRHHWQRLKGLDYSEPDAHAFGEQMARRYG